MPNGGRQLKLSIDPLAFLAGAWLLMVMPLPWVGACVMAAAFHELCHLLAAKIVGGQVFGVTVGLSGAKIYVNFPNPRGERLTALAGPVGSLLLVFFLPQMPRLALCAGVQGLYNLLPLYPMDGGRALRCLLEQTIPERAETLCQWAAGITLLGLLSLAVWTSIYLRLGAWPVIGTGWLCFRWLYQKNSLQIMGNRGTIVLPITKR